MKIEDFLREMDLPKRYFNVDFDISEKFVEEAEICMKQLTFIDGNEFEDTDKQDAIQKEIKKVIKDIAQNFQSVINIFKYYENADPKSAQEELDDMMCRLGDGIFISTIDDWIKIPSDKGTIWTYFRITPGKKFYRVRPVDGKNSLIADNPDELFHIPLSKKALTNNERFSLAGFPGLYLSTMLPLAWQETGYPPKYYFSEFQYEKMTFERRDKDDKEELRFLALYSPIEIYNWGISVKYNNFSLWLNVVMRYLRQYPIILACAFVNHSGKGTYKQEYVIPQMLMQWVQRNNSTVQGISYFTCVDQSTMNSGWCAYDIVIPAMKPFDNKKYSQKLRENFCWTKPKYYEIPVIDCVNNKSDRETVYNYIKKLQLALGNKYVPDTYRNYLHDIMEICCCVYELLERGSSMDMQLMIHVLNVINKLAGKLKPKNIEDIIRNEKMEDLPDYAKSEMESINDLFREIIAEFGTSDRRSKSISGIIDKYRDTIWNSFHCCSNIFVYCSETDDINSITSWLHDNHLIHYVTIIKKGSNAIEQLKQICREIGIAFETLWNCPIGDEDWINENINYMKTPIFVRANDISIYSPNDAKMYDYIHVGFDQKVLEAALL